MSVRTTVSSSMFVGPRVATICWTSCCRTSAPESDLV